MWCCNIRRRPHRSLEERIEAAEYMAALEEPPGPLLVDTMSDEAQTKFSALPERLYIIREGRVVYQGGIGPFDYKVEEVEAFLPKQTGWVLKG